MTRMLERQRVRFVMHELGCDLFIAHWQCNPRLDAVQESAVLAHRLEALGMTDAAARGHPVHFARSNHLMKAEAVAMDDLAREQIRDRRQADVRMWPHVDAARQIRGHLLRSHVIEEHERADHAPLGPRQHAADLESTEIAAPRIDDHLDR
jgi:hypothetical protein